MRSYQEFALHLEHVLRLAPQNDAIVTAHTAFSWQQVAKAITAFEEIFATLSLPLGSQIGVIAHNRAAVVAALVAVVRSGHCFVSFNPMHSGAKIGSELEALRLPLLVLGPDDLREDSLQAATLRNGNAVVMAADAVSEIQLEYRAGAGNSSSFCNPAEGIAVMMQSSGTTGDPKRISLKYRGLLHPISDQMPSEGSAAIEAKTSPAIVTSPLAHIGGLFFALKSIIDARPQILMERFDLDLWCGAVKRHGLKLGHLVPATVKMILDAGVPPGDLASLRAIICGSAALRPDVQKDFEAKYGVPLLVVYGATEFAGGIAGWTVALHREYMPAKLGSVGRAFPGSELRVVSEETGEQLPPGEEGILEARSVQSSAGGKVWVRTTDVAVIDKDHFLWIRGRADAAINRGGFKILPGDVETVLQQHPDVEEAVVVALDDDRLGQVPAALILPVSSVESLSIEKLRAHARKCLSKYQVPAQFLVVDAIPRNASLKPDLPAIRLLFESNQ